jgi:hypothetical protein
MTLTFTDHGGTEKEEADATVSMIQESLAHGLIIEAYPPTGRGWAYLVLHWVDVAGREGQKPIHVVAAPKYERGVTTIVTVYDPSRSPHLWNDDYTERK